MTADDALEALDAEAERRRAAGLPDYAREMADAAQTLRAERAMLRAALKAALALPGQWTLHEFTPGGRIVPPMPLTAEFAHIRRFDGTEFRPPREGETVSDFLAPDFLILPAKAMR